MIYRMMLKNNLKFIFIYIKKGYVEMKNLSKKLSKIVCLAMLANLFVGITPAVFAADANAEVLYKSSFSGYTENGLPDGWVMSSKMVTNKTEVDCDKSDATTVYEEGHGNAVKITASSNATVKDIIPFNKVVSSGKLHISFDGKRPESSSGAKAFVTLFNVSTPGRYLDSVRDADTGDVTYEGTEMTDYDAYDTNDFRGFFGYHASQFLRINYNDGKVLASETGSPWMTQLDTGHTIAANQWYHTDMIIDLDTHRYEVWIDGEKITDKMTKTTDSKEFTFGSFNSNQGRGAFKGFGILQQDGNEKTGTYDNICITHYTTNDEIQMVAETGKDGIGSNVSDGKYLNVAFNDSLNDSIRKSDFEVKDSEGNSVTDFEVSESNKTKSGCVLDFSAAASQFKANTNYTVTYKGNVNGTATGVSAYGASAIFRTNAAVVDTSANDYRYYYAKEDFNEFVDNTQLPFGFYKPSNTDRTNAISTETPLNKYLSYRAVSNLGHLFKAEKRNENGDNCLKMTNGADTLNYFFPRGVVAGNFTMEFDVKYKVGGWSMGLIPYMSYENANIQYSAALTNNHKSINALLGMTTPANYSDGDKESSAATSAPNLAISYERKADGTRNENYSQPNMDRSDRNLDTGLDVEADKWSHIKLDFDMADGNVDIYVTDESSNTTQKIDASYGDWNKFGSGVEGITFFKGTSADTSAELNIDNIEIYTNSGKLLDQNFNGYKSASQRRFPYFWISDERLTLYPNRAANRADTAQPTAAIDAYSVQGKTDSENDQAVKLTGNTNGDKWYTTRFEKTVPAGQNYAVEFDLKYEDDNTIWAFAPVDSTRVTPLQTYNFDNKFVNSCVTDKENGTLLKSTNLLLMGNNNLWFYDLRSDRLPVCANANTYQKFYSQITTDNSQIKDTWKHYKVVALPQETNTKYAIYVDGTKIGEYTDKLNDNKKDIAGIAFHIRNLTNPTGTWGITLDNVQAYLCDNNGAEISSARENTVVDIQAEKLNGDKISIINTNEIPYSTKKITVSFSENLNEILKKDLTPITIKKTTKDSDNVITTDATATVTGVYDCLEDVIQFREQYTEYPMNYTTEIHGNKVIITLADNAIKENTKYSLNIAKYVSFASSPYSTLDKAFSRTYSGAVDPDGGFKLGGCKAVVNKSANETPTWTDVASYDDITTYEGKLGLKFNVTNVTGESKNIRAIAAFYDESGTVSKLVNIGVVDHEFESSAEAQEIVVPIDVPTLANGQSYTTVKFFAWDADTQIPLKRPQEFKTAGQQ